MKQLLFSSLLFLGIVAGMFTALNVLIIDQTAAYAAIVR